MAIFPNGKLILKNSSFNNEIFDNMLYINKNMIFFKAQSIYILNSNFSTNNMNIQNSKIGFISAITNYFVIYGSNFYNSSTISSSFLYVRSDASALFLSMADCNF